jgi:hypothetical protein
MVPHSPNGFAQVGGTVSSQTTLSPKSHHARRLQERQVAAAEDQLKRIEIRAPIAGQPTRVRFAAFRPGDTRCGRGRRHDGNVRRRSLNQRVN